MSVVWTPEARNDLAAIRAHIESQDIGAAQRVVQRIVSATDRLVDHPAIGRSGRVGGTRELVVLPTPYVVAYRVLDGQVEIIRVLHSARRWPDQF
ncbi:MAG: type II toxin-antitoxin system RelE/ParE family toxin [Alphaproteobacteria bacterium]|jgi:toxin ParE1/3/4|nr:type II toxin-antitoxin system RelE/ParE family toxin [Alphaproteobacteria bacterium]